MSVRRGCYRDPEWPKPQLPENAERFSRATPRHTAPHRTAITASEPQASRDNVRCSGTQDECSPSVRVSCAPARKALARLGHGEPDRTVAIVPMPGAAFLRLILAGARCLALLPRHRSLYDPRRAAPAADTPPAPLLRKGRILLATGVWRVPANA